MPGSIDPAREGNVSARTLAFALTAAILVRGALLWLRGPYLDYDETMYLLLARSFLAGEGWLLNGFPHTALGPLSPLLAAAVSYVTAGELLIAQRLISALAGGLLLVPVWYLLRGYLDHRVAATAVALLVAWPALIDVAPKLGPMWTHMYAGSEPLFLFFLFSSFALGELVLRRSGTAGLVLSALAGGALALAYLCRAEAVVVGGCYVLVRGVVWLRERGQARQAVRVVAVALAGFALVALPHLFYLQRVHGVWVVSGQPEVMRPAAETLQEAFRHDRLDNYVRTWYRLDGAHTHLLNPYWGRPEGVSWEAQAVSYERIAAAESPVSRGWAARALNRVWNYGYMLLTLCGPLLAPFVVVGLVVARGRRFQPFVIAGLAASLLTSFYLAVLPRFFLYLVPAFAAWAAAGVHEVARVLGRGRIELRRVAVGAVIVLSLVGVGRRSTGPAAMDLRFLAAEDRRVSELLAADLDVRQVASWHPRLAFWAGWDWRVLPATRLDGLAHYASNVGIELVVLTKTGILQSRGRSTHLLLELAPALRASFASIRPDSFGQHPHPAIAQATVESVAGYPRRMLTLAEAPNGE